VHDLLFEVPINFDVAYYYGLRTVARKRTMESLNKKILADGGASIWGGTSLASISEEAIDFATKEWPNHYGVHTHKGFSKSWTAIWSHAQLQPSNFNVAVWQQFGDRKILQGLAVGSTSSGKKHACLNWVERFFGPEYSKFGVLVPILMCFEEYARLLEVERVLIKNPVDPSIYERCGYARYTIPKSGTSFLSKEIV